MLSCQKLRDFIRSSRGLKRAGFYPVLESAANYSSKIVNPIGRPADRGSLVSNLICLSEMESPLLNSMGMNY